MPNIVTHLAITARVAPEASSSLLLGSALPDFLGMYRDHCGVRIRLAEVDSPELALGCRLHIATDSVFDRQPLKHQLVQELTSDLQGTGLGRGAIRACADPGTEILLDSTILADKDGRLVYDRVKAAVLASEVDLESIGDLGLKEGIERYFTEDRAFSYQDPHKVAQIMHHRLQARSRQVLAFEKSQIPIVTEAFKSQQIRLRERAWPLLHATIAGMDEAVLQLIPPERPSAD